MSSSIIFFIQCIEVAFNSNLTRFLVCRCMHTWTLAHHTAVGNIYYCALQCVGPLYIAIFLYTQSTAMYVVFPIMAKLHVQYSELYA